jgi:DNA invertase Pin-like site-specific DNA recombinase
MRLVIIRWYIRPDTRRSKSQQEAVVRSVGAKRDILYVEDHDGGVYAQRAAWAKDVRGKELAGVTHIDRLATTRDDFSEALEQITRAGKIIYEGSTGRRSDRPGDLAAMIVDAFNFYAGRPSREHMKAMAKKGAAASPVTKPKSGRMPIADAERILNDHKNYAGRDAQIAAINADRRYKVKWSRDYMYRMARAGKLNLVTFKSGPRR